jgi:hypothetical protein
MRQLVEELWSAAGEPDRGLPAATAEGRGVELTDAERERKHLWRLRCQRADLTREEQRLVDAYQMGAMELDEFKERWQRLLEASSRQIA